MNARIVFIDESGFMMAPLVRRTWAPRGVTPVLYQRTRSHRKVSVIAALTLPPCYQRVGLYFSLHTDANVTAHRVLLFLRRLMRQIQKPLLIVWDRLNTHRAVTVNRWLERHPNVHIEYLPPYAPELNPVEHLWGYLKGNPLANWAPKEISELSYATRYHAGRLCGRGKLLRSFLYATPLFSRPP